MAKCPYGWSGADPADHYGYTDHLCELEIINGLQEDATDDKPRTPHSCENCGQRHR